MPTHLTCLFNLFQVSSGYVALHNVVARPEDAKRKPLPADGRKQARVPQGGTQLVESALNERQAAPTVHPHRGQVVIAYIFYTFLFVWKSHFSNFLLSILAQFSLEFICFIFVVAHIFFSPRHCAVL